MTRDELIAVLESAPEGSRELDIAIQEHGLGWIRRQTSAATPIWLVHPADDGMKVTEARKMGLDPLCFVPHYTTSLDAALTLVPEGWGTDGTDTHQYNDGTWKWGLWRFSDLKTAQSVCCKATPALALCIAALKALD